MNRFLKSFHEFHTLTLVDEINEYAKENNLKIISLTSDETLHSAIVLFEGDKPLCKERS